MIDTVTTVHTRPGEEVEELEGAEGQWRAALEKLKHKRRHSQQAESDLQAMGRTLSLLQGEEGAAMAELESKQSSLASLDRELDEMKNKKLRAQKQVH